MAKENKLEIFKVLYSDTNSSLIDQVFGYYYNQESVPGSVLTRLNVATKNATLEKLKQVEKSANNEHIVYVGMVDGKIVSTFTHIYKPIPNEMYLYECNTYESMQNRGFGTRFYEEISEDIFENYKVLGICADAISDSGRKLLEKIGFYPNTKPFSYGGNAILYSPKIEHPLLFIRLETLIELCPTRDFTNSPNVDKYNQMLKQLIYNHSYSEADAVNFFKRLHVSYLKAIVPKTLKKPMPDAPVSKVPLATIQEFNLNGQVFTFSMTPSLTMDAPCMEEYDPAEGEINLYLQKLEKAKNIKGKEK